MGVEDAHAMQNSHSCEAVVSVTTPEAVAEQLRQAAQENTMLSFSQAEAQLLDTPRWLDCSGLNKIRHDQPDDFMIRVQTGVTFEALNRRLADSNQVFSLSYPAQTTVGDILADDRPALETGLRGYPRDYALKTQIATPDGQLTTSGADVVKNVTGYDLHKFYIGAQNAFGVITAATLKVIARPALKRYALIHGVSLDQAQPLVQTLQAAALPLVACELVQPTTHTGSQLLIGWSLFIGLAAEQSLVEEAMVCLETLVQQDFSATLSEAFSLVWFEDTAEADSFASDANDIQAYCDALQAWPQASVVLEAALPLAHWSAFLSMISSQAALSEHWRFQVRPAAGLVFILWPSDALLSIDRLTQSLETFQSMAERFDGFVQIRRLPWEACMPLSSQNPNNPIDSNSLTKNQLLALTQRFNLPADPVIRSLLQSLKASYDPKGILFSPYLPLNPMVCP
jgi:FAD/FMN-containing dehydrogenase